MKDAIATVRKTREIQEKYGVYTKKSFGQNFIIEPKIVEKIADAAIQDPSDLVIEVGPGIGALTQFLCEKSDHVIAFEIDERLPRVLEQEIGFEHLELIMQDFLEADIDSIIEERRQEGQRVDFVSNLPYYITTPSLFKLFEAKVHNDSITVMMQKEVADRFMAKVGSKEYNALSVITQYRCNLKRVMDVNRNVFWPSPNVGSTVLQFTFRTDQPKIDESRFVALVKACFVQRRKTLLNNLQTWLESKDKALALLENAGIEPATRAQQLEVKDFLRLYESLTRLEPTWQDAADQDETNESKQEGQA